MELSITLAVSTPASLFHINRGSANLIIRRAYTTCGCTTAKVSGSIISAGKAALVVVQYDPRLHGAPGTTVCRGVILETNDPEQAQFELWVQGRDPINMPKLNQFFIFSS